MLLFYNYYYSIERKILEVFITFFAGKTWNLSRFLRETTLGVYHKKVLIFGGK